ncbi:MAG: hypothetical protein SGJ20_21085 [Planctomycetota bacterium]|nr:hypothetical protein [Planctomycetota bacterium]
MSAVPRIAVGTVQQQSDSQAVLWGLMELLNRSGVRIQSYRSQATFAPVDAATSITGVASRHLDSWLMSPQQCRDILSRSSRNIDLALVDGQLDAHDVPAELEPEGGRLEPLCNWLGIPRLAVIDVSALQHCQLPARPRRATGLLLDGVASKQDYCRWQTTLESLWGIPVLGGLPHCPAVRSTIAALLPGDVPSRELCNVLGTQISQFLSPAKIMRLASHAEVSAIEQHTGHGDRPRFPADGLCNLRIAVAYDDAFHCYFQDSLDVLEACGATIRDFSPLRDETLPPDTDVVYIGCGHPERFAAALTENHLLKLALRGHVCSGKRIYAEGGGLAYLCQSLELSSGQQVPMLGIFPAVARLNPAAGSPHAEELTLQRDNWLGPVGASVRGYLNERWSIEPTAKVNTLGKRMQNDDRSIGPLNLIGRHHAIGSRMHINLVAQPHLLQNFLQPCPLALAWAGAT